MTAARVRRRPEDARALIMDAAERILVAGGPAGVTVRAVAEQVGMTDAGVAHHFGSREDLLVALLHVGGRKIRAAVTDAVAAWPAEQADVGALVRAVSDVYDQGYGALAVALHAAGWRDPGSGFLNPVVDSLHAARVRAGSAGSRTDTRLAVAALHQALALEPVYGPVFRRSAGMGATVSERHGQQLRWWTHALCASLGLPDPG